MNEKINFITDTLYDIYPLDQEQAHKFLRYYDLLVSSTVNVTSIKNFNEVIVKHFYDSLLISKFLDERFPFKIIDIGSGGGFPGIPIAIAYSNYSLCLLETVGKKVKFLNDVIDHIEITNTITMCGRAEDEGRNLSMREQFDIALSRAVAPLNILLEYMIPFVKVGGFIYIYKGPEFELEVNESKNALKELSAEIVDICTFVLPLDVGERVILKIKKNGSTKDKYPRRSGIPKKRPL